MIFFQYYLWVAPHALLPVLLTIIWRRGWHKRLPFFFCFAGFQLLQFLTLFALSRFVTLSSISLYHWVLTIGLGISALLELGAVFELAEALLLNRVSLSNSLRLLMKWSLAALLLISAAASASFAAIGFHGAARIFSVLDFCASVVEAGLLVTLFLFSGALRISWRSWPTGVALGFGISACINLAASALRAQFGSSAVLAVDITQMAAFHVAVVTWLVYLLVPERSAIFPTQVFGVSEIALWDRELHRMANQ